MAQLFGHIATAHRVPAAQVSAALGRNRLPLDILVNLPFLLLYTFFAVVAARVLWRRYPPAEYGWLPGIVMAIFLSLVFAAGCTMLGELWSLGAETYRIGNNHLSYRANRVPWSLHRSALFAAAWLLFCLSALAAARKPTPPVSIPVDPLD